MAEYQFGSIVDRDFRLTLQKLADEVIIHGKTIQDLIADGQLTEQQYAQLLTTLNGLLKSGEVDQMDLSPGLRQKINMARQSNTPINMDDLAADVLSALDGSGGNTFEVLSIPREGSVTPEKTSFIALSSNRYNHRTNQSNKYVDESGVVRDSTTTHLSNFISVNPGASYFVKDATTLSLYEAPNDSAFTDRRYLSSFGDNGVIVIPDDVYYIRLTMNLGKEMTAQFNEGSQEMPYEDYYAKISTDLLPDTYPGAVIENGTIGLEKLAFAEWSTNLYNKSTTTRNQYITPEGEVLYSTINSLSDFITVTPSTTYIAGDAHTVSYFTAANDGSFIAREGILSAGGIFTTPSNALFIRLTMSTVDINFAQLNEGNELLDYEEHYFGISKDALPPEVGASEIRSTYYFAPEEISRPYTMVTENPTAIDTPEAYNSALNSLADDHPDYLSYTLKGKDSSGQYDIYQYRAKVNHVHDLTTTDKKLPKLIFACGLHGEEKTSIYAFYYFMKDICENWQDDPVLEYLRWNVEIIFIPLANPWGFLNSGGQSINSNNVNINRNFPYLWEDRENSGSGPGSEVETQYIVELMDEHKDALYFGDFHTNGSTTTYEGYDRLMWIPLTNRSSGLHSEEVSVAARYTVEKMTREYIKNHDMPSNAGYFGYLTEAATGGTSKLHAGSLGIPASTIETFIKLPSENVSFSPKTITMGTELLGNWILNLIKQFKNSY